MTTVSQLVQKGYRVVPAQDAIGCTSVTSDRPFWFVNRRFHANMAATVDSIQTAAPYEGGYRLLAAGSYSDRDEFPFLLVDEATKAALDAAAASYAHHEQAMAAAKDGMQHAVTRYEALLAQVQS